LLFVVCVVMLYTVIDVCCVCCDVVHCHWCLLCVLWCCTLSLMSVVFRCDVVHCYWCLLCFVVMLYTVIDVCCVSLWCCTLSLMSVVFRWVLSISLILAIMLRSFDFLSLKNFHSTCIWLSSLPTVSIPGERYSRNVSYQCILLIMLMMSTPIVARCDRWSVTRQTMSAKYGKAVILSILILFLCGFLHA
jgi:hypothetical protein